MKKKKIKVYDKEIINKYFKSSIVDYEKLTGAELRAFCRKMIDYTIDIYNLEFKNLGITVDIVDLDEMDIITNLNSSDPIVAPGSLREQELKNFLKSCKKIIVRITEYA